MTGIGTPNNQRRIPHPMASAMTEIKPTRAGDRSAP